MYNIFTSILIQQLFFQSMAYITSDYGKANEFDFNSGWVGTRLLQFTQQVNFKSAFQNVPQLVITPYVYAVQVTNTQYGYKFSISEVTTTYFKIQVGADYGNINTLKFNWFAIDDQRIEVIHQFNQDNPPTSTNVPHQNKNINTGFILLTSFGGTGAIDFVLSMPTITDSYVQVKVTDSNSLANTHILNIGYTIVLGPPDAFEISALITNLPLVNTNPSMYNSPIHTIDPNKIWFFYPLYFSISSTIIARMMFAEAIVGNTISYSFQCWGAATCIYTKYGHKTTTINLQLTTILYPMLMKKIRVSRSNTEENVNNIQYSIAELNKNYNTIGDDSFEIASSIQTLTMVIKVKCEPNQKVTGKFQRYTSGSNKYFTSSINCFAGQNFIAFYLRFYQAVQQYQYLIVSLTADQILVTQKIANQYLEMQVIAQANILQS